MWNNAKAERTESLGRSGETIMIGIIKKLESGSGYPDGEPRATIKVTGASFMFDELTIPVSKLLIPSPVTAAIDMEVEVTISVK